MRISTFPRFSPIGSTPNPTPGVFTGGEPDRRLKSTAIATSRYPYPRKTRIFMPSWPTLNPPQPPRTSVFMDPPKILAQQPLLYGSTQSTGYHRVYGLPHLLAFFTRSPQAWQILLFLQSGYRDPSIEATTPPRSRKKYVHPVFMRVPGNLL